MSKTIKSFLVVLISVLFATTAYAQSTTASIAGHVTDANGGLQDAVITAVYTPTGITYHAFSGRDGVYRINNVVAGGPYTIKVEMMGHQPYVITNVHAPLSGTIVVNCILNISATTLEAVSVVAEGVNNNMNIQNSGANTLIDNQTIRNIPTTSRSMNDIMKLTPQASVTGGGFAAGGGNYRGSSVTVDGASFNNAFGIGSNLPAGGSPISLDAIDQISINLTPFDVRHSGFQGGAINVVTKHGSNEWHGSLYNYYTSSKIEGKLVDGNELSSSETLDDVMGLTLSGPIIKDKLFFFLNAEYKLEGDAGTTRQARADSNAAWGGSTSFNRPTVDRMNEIKDYLYNTYGYDAGDYQNYSLGTPDYKVLARLDWNINANNTFNVRFSRTRNYTSNSPSNSMSPIGKNPKTTFNINGVDYVVDRNDQGRQSYYTLFFESARYFQEQNFTSVAAELNSRIFNGKGTNILRATWSYQDEARSLGKGLFPTVDILEPYIDDDGVQQYAFYTTFGVDPFSFNNSRRVNTYNFTDEITYSTGIHNIIAGAQYETNRVINGFMRGGAGWYIYDSWESFTSGAKPLSFMITHANLEDPTTLVYPAFNYNQASLYAQDEMEFSQYFKLTAGLRLEMPIISFVFPNYNKEFAEIAAANPGSSYEGLSTDDLPGLTVNVSPRIGFNWDVTKNRKVVVRGGTGIFTGRIPNVWLVAAAGNSNVIQTSYVATGSPDIAFYTDRATIINNIYANGYQVQDPSAPTDAVILAKDLRMPSSWKTSFAVDTKLPFGIKGTLEGIYSYNFNEIVVNSLGYKLGDSIQLPGEPEKRPTYVNENIRNSVNGKMSGYLLHNAKDLHGQYFSITAQLSKSFIWGLDLMAAYTHSFSMTATDGAGDQPSNLAGVSKVNGDNSHELGYSYFVTPNRFIASAGYTIYEGPYTATKLGLFYEGYNIGYVGTYNQSRYSYVMTTDENTGISSAQLVYIPTSDELAAMPFSSEENRAAYEAFIENDSYLSAHRGHYSKRNGAVCPWLGRLNFKVDQEFYFNVGGRKTTLQIGADVNNLANMINSSWGCYQQLSSETILRYEKDDNGVSKYTFTEPTWHKYNSFLSTWNLLLHVRYSF